MATVGNLAERMARMSEPDRRMFLDGIGAALLGIGNLDRLLQYLKSDAFLSARMAEPDWGPLKVVEDFLRSYPAFCEADPGRARQLLDLFLTYLFSNQRRLNIDDVFVWLQHLAQSRLLHDAVEIVGCEAWTPPNADQCDLQRFVLKCRRSRARLWRKELRSAEADRELGALVEEWKNFDAGELKELSILDYEIGYSAYLKGNVDLAALAFFRGAERAAQSGDRVGELINNLNGYVAQFQGRVIDARVAKEHFEEHRECLLKEGMKQPRVYAWLYSVNRRLLDAHCVLGEGEEAGRSAERIVNDPYLLSLHERESHRIASANALGRAAVVVGDWKEALRRFATFLDADLGKFGRRETDLISFAEKAEEMAVCYLDAGTAALALADVSLGRSVWERGLRTRRGLGNLFFHRDIRTCLEQLNKKRESSGKH